MKPQLLLAESVTPDGAIITLHERDKRYAIRVAGRELMNSAIPSSEMLLAELAFKAEIPVKKILLGGLGLGFSLKRLLEVAPPDAVITVVELLPCIVEWNRTHLAELNGGALADPRVTIVVADVRAYLAAAGEAVYDAVLLDVDNGPVAMVASDNARIYSESGLLRIKKALTPGGRLAVWSAGIDERFSARLERVGFIATTVRAKTHKGAHSSTNAIILGDSPATPLPLRMYDPLHPSNKKPGKPTIAEIGARNRLKNRRKAGRPGPA